MILQCHLWQYDVSVNATFTLAGRNLTLMVMAPSFYLAHKQLSIFNMQISFFCCKFQNSPTYKDQKVTKQTVTITLLLN